MLLREAHEAFIQHYAEQVANETIFESTFKLHVTNMRLSILPFFGDWNIRDIDFSLNPKMVSYEEVFGCSIDAFIDV